MLKQASVIPQRSNARYTRGAVQKNRKRLTQSVTPLPLRHNAPHLSIQQEALNEQSRHVMIISGALELAETIQTDLLHEGYKVSVIHDGLRGLLAVKRYEPDLVLIDWDPPRLSGLELCDRLRATDKKKQIILLTQEDCAKERIAGFNAGADDCISLPFIKEEFISRVKASLERLHPLKQQAEEVLRCADLLLNRKTREVFRSGQFVRLTAKEFDLLEYLMMNYFVVVSRSQILENVWGYDYAGSSNIVEVYIRYLRNKLNESKEGNTRLIQTVRSVGYILRDN